MITSRNWETSKQTCIGWRSCFGSRLHVHRTFYVCVQPILKKWVDYFFSESHAAREPKSGNVCHLDLSVRTELVKAVEQIGSRSLFIWLRNSVPCMGSDSSLPCSQQPAFLGFAESHQAKAGAVRVPRRDNDRFLANTLTFVIY
jgi:hypothetical protein